MVHNLGLSLKIFSEWLFGVFVMALAPLSLFRFNMLGWPFLAGTLILPVMLLLVI